MNLVKHGQLLVLAFVLMVVLGACQSEGDVEPQIVYVTATSAETDTAQLGNFPTATLTSTVEGIDSPTPFVSPTVTATEVLPEFPTQTANPTIEQFSSPTLFPTLTPSIEATVEVLQSFPTATGGSVETAEAAAISARASETAAAVQVVPTSVGSPNPYNAPTVATVTGITAPQGGASPIPTLTPRPTQSGIDVAVVEPAAVSDLAPGPDQLPILNGDTIGVQLHPFVSNEAWSNALSLTRQLGMSWIKFQVPWDVSEPAPGEYSFQYERLVLLVQEAHIQGFKVLLSVTRAPDWARPTGFNPNLHGPPEDPQLLANFITKMVTDIKPEFMEAIEIWNEPNLEREWGDIPMDGATYMRYFAPAYAAVKAVDPDAVIITAGLAPVGELPGTRDDRVYLEEMYAAGLADYPDARLGVHPYGWANAPSSVCCSTESWADNPKFFMLDTINDYRDIMLDNGDMNRQMWITELGWGTYQDITGDGSPASPPEPAAFFDFITLTEQADYTVNALEILQAEPYANFIEKTILWNMNFATIENAISDQLEQAGYSFLDATGSPRLVFWYLLNTRKIYPESQP